MSCPQQSTTIAWVYGEAPEQHLHHVAACAACQETVDEQERVAFALSEVRPALAPRASAPRRARWPWLVGTAFAAAAALAVVCRGPVETEPIERAPSAVEAALVYDDTVDAALDDLDADLDWLAADMGAL